MVLTACAVPTEKASLDEGQTTEYFAASEYGVEASPRVTEAKSGLRRGGGSYKLGSAYQVKGRWYQPQQDPDYQAVGAASWYGNAFHGRLTANGEVYDMNHLTAAHPTLPLPSYARVTNLKNDSSVIVRINDRGPFAEGRIIDLSKRAAEMLDYKNSGVAKVQVEYVGPAPLHGQDDHYLMASYQPGGTDNVPADLPDGVMVAMNSEETSAPQAAAATAFAALSSSGNSAVALPQTGPVVPDRPLVAPASSGSRELALMSYTERQRTSTLQMFDALVQPGQTGASAPATSQRGDNRPAQANNASYINLGAWSERDQVQDIRSALTNVGSVTVEKASVGHEDFYVLSLVPEHRANLDGALRAAWSAGAGDAFIVRD